MASAEGKPADDFYRRFGFNVGKTINVYRGQSNSSWPLLSPFARKYGNLKCPPLSKTLFDILRDQHEEKSPAPLIDFSYSPLVAFLFAIGDFPYKHHQEFGRNEKYNVFVVDEEHDGKIFYMEASKRELENNNDGIITGEDIYGAGIQLLYRRLESLIQNRRDKPIIINFYDYLIFLLPEDSRAQKAKDKIDKLKHEMIVKHHEFLSIQEINSIVEQMLTMTRTSLRHDFSGNYWKNALVQQSAFLLFPTTDLSPFINKGLIKELTIKKQDKKEYLHYIRSFYPQGYEEIDVLYPRDISYYLNK